MDRRPVDGDPGGVQPAQGGQQRGLLGAGAAQGGHQLGGARGAPR
ncbi:hypothetical protein [Pseudonocardia sp. ICBG601]|nr:hypothetical protein [Pseudonocardia sp. ICBG601]